MVSLGQGWFADRLELGAVRLAYHEHGKPENAPVVEFRFDSREWCILLGMLSERTLPGAIELAEEFHLGSFR